MKRFAAFLVLALTFQQAARAQQSVAIGTNTVDPKAVLLLVGDGTQGIIIPIAASAPTPGTITPKAGMLVYFGGKIYSGDGTQWNALSGGAASLLKVTGNTIAVDPSGTASVNISSNTPTITGQIYMWDGTGWIASVSATPTNGQVLRWNAGTSRWEPATISSGGTVTSVGVNGGALTVTTPTTTPTVTLNQATGSQAGYLSAADWTTFNNKMGAGTSAGGDLSGTYPNPTVSKIQGTSVSGTAPAAGQVLQFSGGNWGPGNLGMTTLGDILFGGAGGAPTRLAGSAGFLKSTGAAAPAWSALAATDIPNLDAGKITTGTLPVARGGTGTATVPAAGQLAIGSGGNYVPASLSGDVSAVTAAGAVTLANSAATRTNLGLGTLATLSAVTTAEITNGTIVDADVNAAAAIQGTKINPSFGSQNILTSGKVGLGTLSPQNTVDINGSQVIGATYAGSAVAPANSLLVEGSVGVGTTSPSSIMNVYSGSFSPGTGKAVAEFYHNGGNFGSAMMVNSSSGGDGTGTVYAMGKMAGIETNAAGSGNYGFWGHQFGTGAGGWGVIASNGANPTSPDTYVALGGQSFALRIVDGNQAAGAVLKSDASGNAFWGPAQTIAFSSTNAATSQTFAASTWTVVNVPNEEYDLSSNFSANTFTVPAGGGGLYHFTANVNFSTPLVNGRYQIAIWVNGGTRKSVDYNTVGTNFQSMHIDCDLLLNAGDTVTAQMWISGGDTTFPANNYVYFQGRKVN